MRLIYKKGTLPRKVELILMLIQGVLQWHEEHVDIVGASVKLNADCMIHATLEDDKTILKTLYSFGYRLGPDTDRRINKVIGETNKRNIFGYIK